MTSEESQEIIVKVDEVDDDEKIDKDEKFDKDRPHNGSSISMVEISENRRYLVTYSKDDEAIVWWSISDVKGGVEDEDNNKEAKDIKQDILPISRINNVYHVIRMCVSNQNILAYIYINDVDDVDSGLSMSMYYLSRFILLTSKYSINFMTNFFFF